MIGRSPQRLRNSGAKGVQQQATRHRILSALNHHLHLTHKLENGRINN